MHTSPRLAAILLPALLLGACTTFQDYWTIKERGVPQADAVAVTKRPVAEPQPLNHYIIESPEQSVVGIPQVVLTRGEDTLSDLARTYGLGYDELLEANPGVDPWLPGDGTPILLPTQFVLPATARKGIVLNIASKRLFYFPEMPPGQPQVVKTYPIGIGRVGWETPLGAATVIAKAVNPTWYVPLSVRNEHAEIGDPLPSVVPPGPDNPLGTRVLKLDMPGYLIHGTNQPYGVGMRVSHGCVRLYPENIEYLYELVAVGEAVQIINEPYLLGTLDGELYFEAHPPLADDTIGAADRLNELFVRFGEAPGRELSQAAENHMRAIASVASGAPVKVASFDLAEVFARAVHVRNTVVADPNSPTLSEVRQMMDEVMQEAIDEAQAAEAAATPDQS